MRVTEPEINEERITIELVVAMIVWLFAAIGVFWLVGAFAGVIVIVAGLGLFGWWLAKLIRSG
ncbi:MAG: hypothetical protein ABW135_07850 [Thermoleophilaceae bacterium]